MILSMCMIDCQSLVLLPCLCDLGWMLLSNDMIYCYHWYSVVCTCDDCVCVFVWIWPWRMNMEWLLCRYKISQGSPLNCYGIFGLKIKLLVIIYKNRCEVTIRNSHKLADLSVMVNLPHNLYVARFTCRKNWEECPSVVESRTGKVVCTFSNNHRSIGQKSWSWKSSSGLWSISTRSSQMKPLLTWKDMVISANSSLSALLPLLLVFSFTTVGLFYWFSLIIIPRFTCRETWKECPSVVESRTGKVVCTFSDPHVAISQEKLKLKVVFWPVKYFDKIESKETSVDLTRHGNFSK